MNVSIKYITLIFLSLFISIFLSTISFCDELVDEQAEKSKLSVHCQWSHQCNASDRRRTFLTGESIFSFITVSGFLPEQIKEQCKIAVSIFDEDEKEIKYAMPAMPGGSDFLYVNPNVSQNSSFQLMRLQMSLPKTSLSQGNYVLKCSIQDSISGLSGEDKLYFTIVAPNTLKLINVNMGFIATNTPSQDINQKKNFVILQPPIFAIPIGHRIPAVSFQVNGLEINKNNDIDACVKLTQYSEKGIEIWNYEKSYTGKDFIKEEPLPGLFLLPKLCPGYCYVKLEVEDRTSKKKDSIELPYAVINSIDMLNQYNYPKNLQQEVKKINETKTGENN
jgi:hypothetical protein